MSESEDSKFFRNETISWETRQDLEKTDAKKQKQRSESESWIKNIEDSEKKHNILKMWDLQKTGQDLEITKSWKKQGSNIIEKYRLVAQSFRNNNNNTKYLRGCSFFFIFSYTRYAMPFSLNTGRQARCAQTTVNKFKQIHNLPSLMNVKCKGWLLCLS